MYAYRTLIVNMLIC